MTNLQTLICNGIIARIVRVDEYIYNKFYSVEDFCIRSESLVNPNLAIVLQLLSLTCLQLATV